MKHFGDITKISGYDLPIVDIVTGGSPCQDLSVAGKRAGLAGERSGLFMEQIRIIKEMRENDRANGRTNEHIRPRYMVWENVPGAFSSNGGEDFRAVLEETAKVAEGDASIPRFEGGKWPSAGCIMGNGWSIAWRVHDAQFWGVPQRRKRIALVADFGGETAPEILFERKGLSGDIAQGGKEGEGTSGNVERSVGETSGCLNGWDVQSKHIQPENGIAETLYSGECRYGGGESYVMQNQKSVVYGISAYDSNAMKSSNPNSGVYEAKTARTLDLNGGSPACNQGGMAVVQGADLYNGNLTGDVAATLNSTEQHGFIYSLGHDIRSARFTDDEITDPLTATDYKDPIKINIPMKTYQNVTGCLDCGITKGTGNQLANQDMFIANESIVRRLTPLECERLQCYPDGWTDIGEWTDSNGKKHKDADSPRYKALGNSIALPFWSWMAGRMVRNLRPGCTMGSLFDGIGGFPLVYSRVGVEPVWASEIEEFPIAVTKIRFPEENNDGDMERH